MRIIAAVFTCFALLISSFNGIAQITKIYGENFDVTCSSNCFVENLTGWTVTNGANGAQPNRWFVSCTEVGGQANGNCSVKNCSSNNGTLHIGTTASQATAFGIPCATGDCGATYFPGNLTSVGQAFTDVRAESPVINCNRSCDIGISFNYFQGGQAPNDFLEVMYFDGSAWSALTPNTSTTATCNGTNNAWTKYTGVLPVSASGNPNVRVGFRWQNNDDQQGTAASVAIDSLLVYFIEPNNTAVADFPNVKNSCGPTLDLHVQPTNILPNYVYNWTFDSKAMQAGPQLDTLIENYGNYKITLVATSLCSFISTPKVNTFEVIDCSIKFGPTDTTLCTLDCITFKDTLSPYLTDLVQRVPNSRVWTFENGTPATSNDANPTVCFNQSGGPYKVTLTVSYDNLTNTVEHFVTKVASCTPPVADFVFQTPECEGDPITFTYANTGNPPPPPPVEWNWDFTGGTPSSFVGEFPPAVTYATAGTYTVNLTVKNDVGDQISKSQDVEIIVCGPPVADFEASSPICAGSCVEFFDRSTSKPVTWEWTFTGGSPGTSTLTSPGYICYDQPGTYSVKLKVINKKGVDSLIKDDYITVLPNPTATITVNDKPNLAAVTTIAGAPVQLEASGGVSYRWYPPIEINSDTISNPIVSPVDTTIYVVTVTDENGCTAQSGVIINAYSQNTIFVPNLFSPNGDSANDEFYAHAAGVMSSFELRVFNRWGTEIFVTNDINYAWNGTFDGKDCPVGVYVWFYKAVFPDGKTFKGKGDVTLIR